MSNTDFNIFLWFRNFWPAKYAKIVSWIISSFIVKKRASHSHDLDSLVVFVTENCVDSWSFMGHKPQIIFDGESSHCLTASIYFASDFNLVRQNFQGYWFHSLDTPRRGRGWSPCSWAVTPGRCRLRRPSTRRRRSPWSGASLASVGKNKIRRHGLGRKNETKTERGDNVKKMQHFLSFYPRLGFSLGAVKWGESALVSQYICFVFCLFTFAVYRTKTFCGCVGVFFPQAQLWNVEMASV